MGSFSVHLEEILVDICAVAVIDGRRKVAILKRISFRLVHKIKSINKVKSPLYLRPLDIALVNNHRLVPQQRCAFVFYCEEVDTDVVNFNVNELVHQLSGGYMNIME